MFTFECSQSRTFFQLWSNGYEMTGLSLQLMMPNSIYWSLRTGVLEMSQRTGILNLSRFGSFRSLVVVMYHSMSGYS